MLGFVIGTVVVIGALKVLRRSACGWRGYGGCGHGWRQSHGYDQEGRGGGWQGWRRSRGPGGPRWALRWLFERLETTPGQEKAIALALTDLRASGDSVRQELAETRADIARALSDGLVHDMTLEETFARHDRLLAVLRVSFVEALKKITEALDERQRKELVTILKGRSSWFEGHGPGIWA